MTYTIVGLGNPGQEYEGTRHNTGRIALENFIKKNDLGDFEFDKKLNAQVSEGKVGKGKVVVVFPETFMNKSGDAIRKLIKNKKDAKTLVVIHDDLDLPIGRVKISFNKSSGGHRGVESIIKAVKTQEFIRIRVGISKATASGKLKKPIGEEAVGDFIIGKFKKDEMDEMKKISKIIAEALEVLVNEGKDKVMSVYNRA